DAGILKADPSFAIYTKLVEPYDAEFQLQCLPTNQYNNLVIPIGIDCKADAEIVLSVQTVQLDPTCKVILEDKLTHTFTDLSKNSYKAAVAANTSTSERFFLHTGDIISGLEDQSLADGKVTAYAKGNKEIRVIGEVGEGAVATLFNGLGQVVLTKRLGAGSLNIIGLPTLTSGLYLLNINDNGTSQTIKVMVRR
ncbi:MAG: T9SS type A sorting domain-containing protein, partial [Mariniphaga sp.]